MHLVSLHFISTSDFPCKLANCKLGTSQSRFVRNFHKDRWVKPQVTKDIVKFASSIFSKRMVDGIAALAHRARCRPTCAEFEICCKTLMGLQKTAYFRTILIYTREQPVNSGGVVNRAPQNYTPEQR
jgi:hypothetical protein